MYVPVLSFEVGEPNYGLHIIEARPLTFESLCRRTSLGEALQSIRELQLYPSAVGIYHHLRSHRHPLVT